MSSLAKGARPFSVGRRFVHGLTNSYGVAKLDFNESELQTKVQHIMSKSKNSPYMNNKSLDEQSRQA